MEVTPNKIADVEMMGCSESDSMIEKCGKLDESNA